jgi:uncharacterized membrane protein YtjA (UPF0391 family)
MMLRWALLFLVISLMAAFFGFSDIAAGAAQIAEVLFYILLVICAVFLVLCAVFLVFGLTVAQKLRA